MVLIAGLSNPSLNAQTKSGVISGTVIDKTTSVPIEGADVTLHRTKDSSLVKGTSTTNDGSFTLNEIPNGNYFLRSNLVGYNFAVVSGLSVTADNQNITLQPIKLITGTTTTEEIVVESEKSFIEFKPDKKVFNVSKNLVSQGGMLIDLLREIPSVNVDQDGNVSLRGGEGVRILIDGRPFGLEGQGRTAILEQTPASDVESVELITNPSAKYEAEGSAGIINIVMKKNLQQGMGYTGNLGLNLGTGDKYSGQFSLSLRNDKINVFGNYSYNNRNMTSSGFSDRIYYNNSLLSSIDENSTGRMRGKSHNVKLGMDYFIDNKNTLGLSFNYRNNNRSRSGLGEYIEYDLNNNPVTNYFSNSLSDDKGSSIDANLNYTLKFKKPMQVLTADLSYSRDVDNDLSNTSNTYINPVNTTPPQRYEYENEINNSFSGKLDYVQPFSKDTKLEAGYKGSYKQRQDDYRVDNFDYTTNHFVTDYNQSNNFIYKEQIHGLYGIFTSKIKNFGYSLGARIEQTFVKGELQTTGQNFSRNYIDIFPSASISQKITNNTEIQLSYSRRVNRPRMGQLNPFRSTSFGNTNNYSEGNPNLNPEFTDSYELSFIQFLPWATITPSVFYRYTKDEIARTRTLIDSVSTLSTFVNYNSSRSYGGELIVNLQPVDMMSLNGTFSYFRREVDATNLQSGLSNKGDSWTARAMSTFKLPADLNLQMSYFYSGRRVSAQGIFEPIQMFDAAVKKDFFGKKLSVTFKVSDLFDQAKFRYNFFDPSFSETSERSRDSRTFFLNLSYNFGQQDKKQDKRKRGNNENEPEDDDGYGF
ncbi:MAG: TonB-dependent receptor [Ignavibacteria bacterium]|nr:TonB-dependent receptor [Ignavibacteria bacterium]